MEQEERPGFARSVLPWVVAGGALIVYLITLNRWVSLSSLELISSLTAPSGSPPLSGPLLFLVTYPFRWLPAGIQVTAWNVLSAVFASLTLALLARSVALLPHDRNREERHCEFSEDALLSIRTNWMPPLFAVLLCGLQISFWEHATTLTGEVFDLFLFAYVIRCLLEYRIDPRPSWLSRFALVYGLAATNNYAMIGYFPAFLVALVWIRGLEFFQPSTLGRLAGWGLAGLSLYLLLPLLIVVTGDGGLGFWQALRAQLAAQKSALLGIPRLIVFFGLLTSLIPVFLIGVRWPSSFGDTSAVGNILTNWGFRFLYALFFVAIVWAAFDAPFSPRIQIDRWIENLPEAVASLPFLSFYYLGALCAGYIVGFFLLLHGPSEERGHRRPSGARRALNAAVVGLVWVIAVVVPVGLVVRNLPAMRLNNGGLFREFAQAVSRSLPARGAILFSDHQPLLALQQIHSNQQAGANRHLPVNTRLLSYWAYQEALHRQAPTLWPVQPFGPKPPPRIPDTALMEEVTYIAATNVVYYLHPSFGYFFEPLYLVPDGVTYRMAAYQTNEIVPPALDPALVERNRKFWNDLRPRLEQIATAVRRGVSDARAVGRWYSRALNDWGVRLQRLSPPEAEEAGRCFELAYRLNPNNLIAGEVNLAFNRTLVQGQPRRIDTAKALGTLFGVRFRNWNDVLQVSGPIDEPGLCQDMGEVFLRQSLPRQAALQFLRVLQVEPGNVDARVLLASTFAIVQMHDRVLETVEAARQSATGRPLTPEERVQLTRLQAAALQGKNQVPAAVAVLKAALKEQPGSVPLTDALVELYHANGQAAEAMAAANESLAANPTNPELQLLKAMSYMRAQQYADAETILTQILSRYPDHTGALLVQGALLIQVRKYTEALPPLNRILGREPSNMVALMNRAIALLQSGQLDDAEKDYRALLARLPELHRVHYGLGEIAFRRKDSKTAVHHYELYLQLAPTNTDEAREVAQRLQQLKAGAQ